MATVTQTKLVGFGYGNKSNYNATTYANHIWFDPTNKQILLNGIEYIPKKLSELVNDGGFLTSANFKIENTSTTAVKKITIGNVSGNFYTFDQGVNGNYVLAGATSSSSNTGATFRKLVEADIPALSIGKITNLQSTLDTKLSSITKSMVEGVLTGNITSHTHFSISTEGDNRNVTTTPNDYSNKFVFKGLKLNSQIGSPASNSYSYLLGLRGWSDSSGGQSHELAFNDTGIYRRQGEKTAWGSWTKILDSDNYTDYAATKDHTHTFASITSKPNTLSGYGITDAYTKTETNTELGKYLPLTGGTLSGALTCNGDYINMNNDSGSRGYRGFFNQSNNTNRASGSHIFMGGGGYALGTNSVSIGYQAYAGIRNEDADKTTYPYIAWQWFPTEKFMVDATNSATLGGGEYYGFPLLPNEMVQWNIGGQNVIYENSSSYKELLVVIKASDADTGLVFGGKTTLPYRASKTLIAGKYIVGSGEYLKKITEITINNVKYYQVIIYTWNTTAFPTSYDFTQQVKVMCATKVSNSNYNGASSYASGNSSVASGYSSVASHNHCTVLARNGETMSSYQTIVGKFNAKVAGLFIIGNGTSDTARSNAFVVDDSGNVTAKYFSGYANAVGGEGFKIYPENNNQINFGGTGSDNTVVFGAASKDSRSVPTTYKFGADGKATLLGSADMLDGYHETKFFRHRGAANSTSISSPPTSSDLANITGIGSYVVQHSGHSSHLLNFNCEGGSTQYIQFLADYGNILLFRCSTDSNLGQPWKKIAFTDSSITGNSASATKLQTARTLWGQSFDGTANVGGKITVGGDVQYMVDGTTRRGSNGARLFSDEGFIGFSKVFGMNGVGSFTGISLGWGANPETDAASVRINDTTFTYKSYPILHSNNYSDYVPTKTGSGASGTWGISISGNAATATKLGSADVGTLNTPIYLNSGAAAAVTSIKESLLTYGMDSNFNGSVSPIDMAISAIHSANRIAFGNPNGVTVEYSTDGGVSWLDYGATYTQKTRLISGLGQNFYIGGSNATTTVSTLFMLRITLNAVNLGTYTRPRKALINISTGGTSNCQVKVESATVGNPTVFTIDATYPISGYSGWNSIPLGYKGTFGGSESQTSNNGVFRFTFSIGELSSSSSNRLSVSDIAIYGETYWTTPSTLARTGHLYTYDETKNVTFPAKVTATTFVGALSGNATTATTASKLGTTTVGSATQPIYLNGGTPTACTYTLGKSVPSNAVFTDTTYSVATASADGLMSAAMFNAKFVDSVGVKQGLTNTSVDGTVEVLSHSIYIRPHKTNVGGGYTDIAGNWDVAIPNATTDYDGSMSYTDKRKLDGISPYAPKKVVALRLSFNADATVTVISGGGDYDMTQDAELMGSKYVKQTSTNNLYLTTFELDTAAASTNTLNNLFRNSFVKFSFMGKSTSGISDYSITVKSNFDDDVLAIQLVSTKQDDSWVVDCVWEFF